MKPKKPTLPVTTRAQRESMAEDWVKLREKIGDRMREAHEAHMYAFGALLNLELLFGQPPTPPETVDRSPMVDVPRQYGATQTVPPPAPAWRSMASAPRDGSRCVLLIGCISGTPIMRVGYLLGSGCHWRTDNGMLWAFSEIIAWAPIPEWTGEVAE